MSKYYSIIIVSQDGEETARFDGLRVPELVRKIEAAIEVGSFAIVDEGEKEEQPMMLDLDEGFIFDTNTSGIL